MGLFEFILADLEMSFSLNESLHIFNGLTSILRVSERGARKNSKKSFLSGFGIVSIWSIVFVDETWHVKVVDLLAKLQLLINSNFLVIDFFYISLFLDEIKALLLA